ncbi:CBS domain containing-hemolysin-like protein [Friedmanniella endophytica]|uniref:CBS domain containing-hemolysin-like protein n=1 Tax=Microlunatus kandeliicorticis TaxID=1759536 RepID=A0A7W3ISM7_9ACTN|nr:hemolysin family protein [Microlunatus kandeliicorticis]MBA8794516.1 CBS domain containing-hemolysin-like protein [Microlunatus kandeliicorticis]
MNGVLGLLLTVVLLALNALFVGSEFALVSARRARIEPLAERGSRRARSTLKAMEEVSQVMAAAQLGITVCTLALGAVSEPVIAHAIEPLFAAAGVPESFVHPIALVLATALVVWAHVVLGEMVPKNLALVGPERAALVLGPFMRVVVIVVKPVVVALNAVANTAMRLFRVEPKDEVGSTFTQEEVAGMVEESRREGVLDEHEYGLLTGALQFESSTATSVQLDPESLVTVARGVTPAEVEQLSARTGWSRFPVRAEDGELSGYLHLKDVLEVDETARTTPVPEKRIRPLATVPGRASLAEALQIMQRRGAHVARVADVRGEVTGVVMLEDVLERLVGEIRDQAGPATTTA